jgi:hypothetical protein
VTRQGRLERIKTVALKRKEDELRELVAEADAILDRTRDDRCPTCGAGPTTIKGRAVALLRRLGPTHYVDLAAELYPHVPSDTRKNRMSSLLVVMARDGLVRRSGRRGFWETSRG